MTASLLVKICGITRVRDAVLAADLGAELIGLNFYPQSPRYVTRRRARAIADRVRGRVKIVGVFVNETIDAVRVLGDDIGLDLVQLHGDEPADFMRAVGRRAVKAFPLTQRRDLEALENYPCPNFHLVDARSAKRGGSGRRANWILASEAARAYKIVLAGGLNPDNVAAAVAAVRPCGVDVASGVESAPGMKDPRLIERFIRAARVASAR